jgi:hypothetical protein
MIKYENLNIFGIPRISAYKLLEVIGIHLIDIALLYFFLWVSNPMVVFIHFRGFVPYSIYLNTRFRGVFS